MRLSIVASALLLSIVSAAPVRRASEPGIPTDTCPRLVIGGPFFAPVPGSCTKYYYCDVLGFDEIFECYYPEVFNPNTGTCTTLPPGVTCENGAFSAANGGLSKRANVSIVRRALWRIDHGDEEVPTDSNEEAPKDDKNGDTKDNSGVTPPKDDMEEDVKDDSWMGPKEVKKEDNKEDSDATPTKDVKDDSILLPKEDKKEDIKSDSEKVPEDDKGREYSDDDSSVTPPKDNKKEDAKDNFSTTPPEDDKETKSSKDPEGDGLSIGDHKFGDQEELDNYGEGYYRHRYHGYRGDGTGDYRQDDERGHRNDHADRYEDGERGYRGNQEGRYGDHEHGYSDTGVEDGYEDTEHGDDDDGQEGDDYNGGDDEHI